MDVEHENAINTDEHDVYILSAKDVENILNATDALYWTILQNLRGRGRPIQVESPNTKEHHHAPDRLGTHA